MKKFLLLIFSLSVLFHWVFAYSHSSSEKLMVTYLSSAIENLIEDKWEDYRNIYIERLEAIKINYSDQERVIYIVDETIKKISLKNTINSIVDDLQTTNCISEWGVSNSSIWPDYKPCCSGLGQFNPYSEDVDGWWVICYQEEFWEPICTKVWTSQEWRYYENWVLLRLDSGCYFDIQ